jgi:hypothetical protein
VTIVRRCGNIFAVTVNIGGNPATYFGRQMKKERLARGWSLREFSAHTGVNIGHASRIENGKRPPTEKVAAACDLPFPERKNWFSEYYAELSEWAEVPPAFKGLAGTGREGQRPAGLVAVDRIGTSSDRGLRQSAATHLPGSY